MLHLDIADLATNIWQQVSFIRNGGFRGLTKLVPKDRAASLGVLEGL